MLRLSCIIFLEKGVRFCVVECLFRGNSISSNGVKVLVLVHATDVCVELDGCGFVPRCGFGLTLERRWFDGVVLTGEQLELCGCGVAVLIRREGGMKISRRSMSRSRSRIRSKSRSRSRSRSRSPRDRSIRSGRHSYRDALYRSDKRRSFSQSSVCNNCKRTGHFARDCPNVAVCNTCGLPGHIAVECSTQSLCWNCREPGHMASSCLNKGICHSCGKAGHSARDCPKRDLSPGDLRLCTNCFKQGHVAVECTNNKACKNCRKTGHLASACQNEPVCNLCNVTGHVARLCPKADLFREKGGVAGGTGGRHGGGPGGYRDVACRSCGQMGHMSRECMSGMVICHNCGGRGHMAYACPSGRPMDRGLRRY